jgi:hypothetical protein
MPIQTKASNPLSFVPLDPNKNLEFNTRERRDLTKGAFSDQARIDLAMSVKHKKSTVQMDKWLMDITYYESHIYICNSRGVVPCGVFNYDTLRGLEV